MNQNTETHQMDPETITTPTTRATTTNKIFLIINCIMLGVGNCGGPLIMRLYFLHGGKRIWLSCFLQTAGWPIFLIPILLAYTRRPSTARAEPFFMKPRLIAAASFMGILIGVDNYLYATGVSKLPVSTSALIVATQLIFTSTFAFFLVKQKFTPFSINAIVLLTVGAVVLGLHANSDRPNGETERDYLLGFFMTVAAAALCGFLQPLVELTYAKAGQEVGYTLVLQFQMVMCCFATGLITVAMLINRDFQAIPKEAKAFSLGETTYYVVLCFSPIIWQCFFLGVIGVIFYASALFSGIMITVTLPMTQIFGVVLYHENFQSEKGVSLFLSLWGFCSYFYGEFKQSKIKNNNKNVSDDDQVAETELISKPVEP